MKITAKAPATVANVFTGFDILGFEVPILYDEVTLQKNKAGVAIRSITGVDGIPRAVEKNTAGVALTSMIRSLDLDFGFDVYIHKGIPLGSGLGGSAASAVAAVVAANEFLDEPLDKQKLIEFALAGEAVSSGGKAHGDNIAASLFGGLTMCVDEGDFLVRNLPIPDVQVLLIHPHLVLKTSEVRSVLSPNIDLKLYVRQSMKLAMFMHAIYEKNLNDLQISLEDLIIEPQRKQFIPHFEEISELISKNGGLGFSISGAGPTVFAWFRYLAEVENTLNELERMKLSFEYNTYCTKIGNKGAYIITE